MLPKYIKCPWCKSPMHLVPLWCDDSVIRYGEKQLRDYYYECDCCGAESCHAYFVGTNQELEERLLEMISYDKG